MIIKADERKAVENKNMRGGDGVVSITHHADVSGTPHCRLLAELTLPVGASIGEHAHPAETEFYLIRQGEGIVKDDGEDKKVSVGDVVITGDGASHNIRNCGDVDLILTAVIVTEAQ